VLAAWIIAAFGLVVGLSLLSFHHRDVHDEGIAAVTPRWYAAPVADIEDWNEVGCGTGIRSCPGELTAVDRETNLKITQSQGDSVSWRSVSHHGRAQEVGLPGRVPMVDSIKIPRAYRSANYAAGGSQGILLVACNLSTAIVESVAASRNLA
jgi:hypothetical protein